MIRIERGSDGNIVVKNQIGKNIGHVHEIRCTQQAGTIPVQSEGGSTYHVATGRGFTTLDLSMVVDNDSIEFLRDLFTFVSDPEPIHQPKALPDQADIKHRYIETKPQIPKPGRFNQIIGEIHDDE